MSMTIGGRLTRSVRAFATSSGEKVLVGAMSTLYDGALRLISSVVRRWQR